MFRTEFITAGKNSGYIYTTEIKSIVRMYKISLIAIAILIIIIVVWRVRKRHAKPTLYERLGGVFAIAAVVDHFSDALIENPIVGQQSENPQLREWHTSNLGRLPGLKFMRTLWVCDVSGGPLKFVATRPGETPLGLEEAHRTLKISPAEFDEVAAELGRTLDVFKIPGPEKEEV